MELVDCRRAVHAAVRDGRLVPRHSFFQLHVARASRRKGIPVSLIQHDDIALFKPGTDSEPGPVVNACLLPPAPRHLVVRAGWPCDGESRYGPGPLHPRPNGLQTASQNITEAHDHSDQHYRPRTRRPEAPVGGTR